MQFTAETLVVQVVMMVITTVLGWVLGALREKSKAAKEKRAETESERESAREVDRLLLYDRISDLYDRFVVQGEKITIADKERAQETYEYYKARGGNGAGTQMYSEIMALKVQS